VASLSNFWGADLSWPQCRSALPAALPLGFVIVGLNDGRPFTTNPCLGPELGFAQARSGYAVYVNVDAPATGDAAAYGRTVGRDDLARLHALHLHPPVLWLDVELANHWSSPPVNVAVLRALIEALHAGGVVAGVYSSPDMWVQLTGGATLTLPVWTAARVLDYRQLGSWCVAGLGGHPAMLAQYLAGYAGRLLDIDVLCNGSWHTAPGLFLHRR
jgi:hypothetical protein